MPLIPDPFASHRETFAGIGDFFGDLFRRVTGQSNNPTQTTLQKKPPQTSYAVTDLDANRRAANAKKKAAAPAGPDIMSIFQRLFDAQAGQLGQQTPYSDLLKASQRSAGATFDPQIAAMQALISSAKKTGKESQADVKDIYKALADSYAADIKQTKDNFNYNRENERARLSEYQTNLRNNYGDSMDSLTDTFKQLGIEAAAPDVMPELAQDQGDWANIASRDSAAEQQALNQMESGELAYYTKGPNLANQESANVQSELVKQLQAFLVQQQSGLQQLQAQKTLAQQAALSQLQQQQAGIQDDAWKRLLESGRFMMDYQKQQASLQSKAAPKPQTFSKGLKGASQVMQDLLGSGAGRVYNAFQDMLLSPEFRPATGQLDPNQAAYIAVEKGRALGLSQAELTALLQGVFAYYGKLQ